MTRALPSLVVLAAAVALGAAVTPASEMVGLGPRAQVVVQLSAPPLAYAHGDRARARVDSEQHAFAVALRRTIPAAAIHWRYRIVANGVSVVLPRGDVPSLSGLPGVRRVYGSVTYHALAGPDAATIRARELPGTTLPNAGAGVKIAIVDDGVDQRHAFFDPTGYTMPEGFPKGQVAYTTAKVIVARAFPPPGATWRDAARPFDPEESGHATHVAGIAAGNASTLANGTRISGVAPRAYIGSYKALTIPTASGLGLNGNAPEIVAAIEAAVADGMDVINLSLGEPEVAPSRDLVALALDAAAAAGVVPVVAAGNDYEEYGRGSLSSPGSAADAITVGAVTSGADPALTSYSAAGPTAISLRLKPDVVAPGNAILSSTPGGWSTSSGTSMAAPHVSGAVALLLQRHPDWTPAQVKAALVATARPVTDGEDAAGPDRAGAGLVDVAGADRPLLRAAPTSVSFGLVAPDARLTRTVALEDAGDGAGTWSASVEPSEAPPGAGLEVPPQVVVPGPLPIDLVAGAARGEISGVVVLRRETVTRRIPVWGRVDAPRLSVEGARTLQRNGVYVGDTRGRPALVDAYRYPEVPRGGPVTARLAGPEQVFRVRISRPVANFGVAVVGRGAGSRVEPRIVSAADESRLTGYAALPLDQNPYVSDFGRPVPAAGALRPVPGTYYVVFDSPSRANAGTYRFRFWVDDLRPPTAALLRRTVRAGQPLRVRVADGGSGIDPRSIDATVDGRASRARLVGSEVRVPTDALEPGRHRLRLELADYQETRNNENVTRILPNTRILTVTVTVLRPA